MAVLLGDDQVIGTEITFYQRLLARDEDQAGDLARAQQVTLGPIGVMDRIIIPTLVLAARDLSRRKITIDDEAFIVTWSRDIVEHQLGGTGKTEVASAIRALGIAAHRSESELLLEMLALAAAPEQGRLEVLSPSTPFPEVIARVEHLSPEVVCVASLPPDGGPFARQLCHRLKERFPGLPVVAFRPDEPGVDPARAALRLREAGADLVVATLAEATAEMSRRLQGKQASPSTGEEPAGAGTPARLERPAGTSRMVI
jgi:hypothetical protein